MVKKICANCGCEVYEWAKNDPKMYKVIHKNLAEHNLSCKCRNAILKTTEQSS